MRNLVSLFFVLWFVPPQPHLQFWEDHPGSEKLWPFIKEALLDIQGIPISHNKNTRTIGELGARENNEIPCPVGPLPEFESFGGSVAHPTASATSTSSTTWSRAVTPTQRRHHCRAQFHCFRWSQHSSGVKAKQRLPASRRGSGLGLGLESRWPLPRHCDRHVPGKWSAYTYTALTSGFAVYV